MPIKQLQSDTPGLPRAGVIRLGYKVETGKKDKNGNPAFRPVEADHFVLTDAPGVAEAVGTDKPTELKVFFPFDDINLVFPAYMQQWQASALVCRGDGEHITYAIDPTTGKQKIRDGLALMDFAEGQKSYKTGQAMPCPGPERGLYSKCQFCKPNAMLIVLLRDVPRLAYWQISTTSIHNIVDLTKQLNTVKETIGQIIGTPRLTGVPFILKRVKRCVSTPKKDGGRQRLEKWFLQLEIEAEWVMRMLTAQRRLADPMARFALTSGQPQEDIIEPEPIAAKAPFGFSDPPRWEPVEEAEIIKEPEPEQPKIRPVLSPAELKAALEKKIARSAFIDTETKEQWPISLHPLGDEAANLVSAKFQVAFGSNPRTDEMYHDALRWLTGKESATELTAPWADALLDWLLNGNKEASWKAVVIDPAPEEARAVYQEVVKARREAEIAAGQVEMSFDDFVANPDLEKLFPRGGD